MLKMLILKTGKHVTCNCWHMHSNKAWPWLLLYGLHHPEDRLFTHTEVEHYGVHYRLTMNTDRQKSKDVLFVYTSVIKQGSVKILRQKCNVRVFKCLDFLWQMNIITNSWCLVDLFSSKCLTKIEGATAFTELVSVCKWY